MKNLENPFERIRHEYDSLSKQQRAISDCILEKGLEIAFMSANQLAQVSNTSPATVVRFTKYIGYASYLDFTEELHQMIVKDYRPMDKLGEAMRGQSSQEISLGQTIYHDETSLSSLMGLNREETVQEAIKLFCNARKIYVTGSRSAYALVHYFGFLLRELVQNVEYFQSSADDVYEMLEFGNNQDVLFVISFRRYARSTYQVADFCKKRGTNVIGLTDVPNSPLCRVCSLSLYAPNNTPFYSYTAAMTLLNSLVWGFAHQKGDQLSRALKERQQMLLEQNIFV